MLGDYYCRQVHLKTLEVYMNPKDGRVEKLGNLLIVVKTIEFQMRDKNRGITKVIGKIIGAVSEEDKNFFVQIQYEYYNKKGVWKEADYRMSVNGNTLVLSGEDVTFP
jgi:hypothetical protein